MGSVDPQSVHAAALLQSDLPSDWAAVRLKFLLSEPITDGPHLTPEFISEGFPFLSVDGIQNGELEFERCRYISDEDHKEFSRKASPRRDDILLGKAASTGKVARVKVDTEFSIWSPLALLRADKEKISGAFLEYCLKSTLLQSQIDDLCSSNTQKNISMGDIPRLLLPLPSLGDQHSIASYLVRETAYIDSLIAEKERMLALLEEKRSALITRVVTRGLDSNAPLKPSGQEWLEEIPAHWELRRIKFVSAWLDQGSSPIASNTPAEADELGVLKLSAVSKGRFRREENKALRGIEEGEQPLALRKGDVLITRGNTPDLVADVACVPEDEPNLLLPDLIYRLRVKEEKILAEFLTAFLTTAEARFQIRRDARGSSGSMVKVSQGHVLDWLTPLPPIFEQVEIMNYLRRTDERFQSIARDVSSSLSLLSDRRAALISAAVTGQIPLEEMTE